MWVVIQTDDWMRKDMSTGIMPWLKLIVMQKSGKISTTLQELSDEFGWDKSRTKRFLAKLAQEGFIEYTSSRKGIEIEIINFDSFPTPSHQQKVKKAKKKLISGISGKLPIKDLSTQENFAIYAWRMLKEDFGETLTHQNADLANWSNPVRLMMEQDGRTKEQILERFNDARKDEFWRLQVRSTQNLRKHFDKITISVKEDKPTKVKGKWLNKPNG